MDNANNEGEHVKEPAEVYQGNRVLYFSSLEEQEEANYNYWLSLTPEERLSRATELIKKVFSEQLSVSKKSNRIFFDQT